MNPQVYSTTDIAPTVSAILNLPAPAQSTGTAIKEIVDDLASANRVAILMPGGPDTFAWNRRREEIPYLSYLYSQSHVGVRSVPPSSS